MKFTNTKNLAQALYDTTDGKSESEVSASIKNFVKYLSEKSLLKESNRIISEYEKIYNQKNNILETTVTFASPSNSQTIHLLKNTLKEKYKSNKVNIIEKIDKNILGGIKIQIGDMVYDDTIQSSLKELGEKIIA